MPQQARTITPNSITNEKNFSRSIPLRSRKVFHLTHDDDGDAELSSSGTFRLKTMIAVARVNKLVDKQTSVSCSGYLAMGRCCSVPEVIFLLLGGTLESFFFLCVEPIRKLFTA